MAAVRRVAVIDIGKTNAKVVLVDLATLREVDQRRMPNAVRRDGPYPHHDAEALWTFILDSLRDLKREAAVDAVSITAHGATAALVDAAGGLALPILDYEFDGPDALAAAYEAARPAFAETGSPRLPMGLNLGAQLFWQQRSFPADFARVSHILAYPQYWAFRLSGRLAGEVTSLGCHTDLWNPTAANFSTLVDRMDWRRLMPPLRRAGDRMAAVLPAVADRTGLDAGTPVLCGIHDSNASLYPHLLSRPPPFSVISTGTWVVSMAVGGENPPLDPARDTLVNVDTLGDPVPSARFMGGREHEILAGGREAAWTAADVAAVLRTGIMLLPSVGQGSGPFPRMISDWLGPAGSSAPQRAVAASFYLAMMTATCLGLIGARGDIVLEGPFARNTLYADMLSAATGRAVLPRDGQAGTSVGAAMLAAAPGHAAAPTEIRHIVTDKAWVDYAARWRDVVSGRQS